MSAKKTTAKPKARKPRPAKATRIEFVETPVEEIEVIAPTPEEIEAAILGEAATELHAESEALAAAACLPTYEFERRADHAIATARSRGR